MAVQMTTVSPAVRRSPRLGSPCLVPTRKRARVPDSSSEQLASSSSEATPRSIRAQKRQKILDGSSLSVDTARTRTVKRKSLPDQEQHHYQSDHNKVVKKKRKPAVVNDGLAATTTSSSLKIGLNPDTRQRGANNPSKISMSPPVSKSRSKLKPAKVLDSSSGPSRMITRTMKKGGGLTSAHISATIIPPTLPSSDISNSDATTIDIQPSSNAGSTFTNDAQPSLDDIPTCTADTSPILSSSPTPQTIDLSSAPSTPLSMSISSLSMSFLNVSPSNPMPTSLNMNVAFLNMPLSMSLSMPMPTGMSTTLAPSESELGFGFQPQEEFSSTEAQRDGEQGKGKDREGGEHMFMNAERLLQRSTTPPSTTNETTSSPDISLSSHYIDRPSSPPPPLPLQSCTPCLNPTTIPPRLAISTCVSDQSQPTSGSSMANTSHMINNLAPTTPTCLPHANATSPTHSSPLKAVCFPPQQPSYSTPQPLPLSSVPMMVHGHERGMKEWATMDIDMAEGQRQQQGLAQEIDISFGDPSLGQGDELRLAQLQGQQELEEERDRSPLLGPAPQPPSLQLETLPQDQSPLPPCSSSSSCSSRSSRQYHKKMEYQNHQLPEWTPKIDKERNLWKVACKVRVWEITKRYTPDTIRTVVAQEAHDYYSVHGFPLGYGLVPVRGKKRRQRRDERKMAEDDSSTSDSSLATAAMMSTLDSDLDSRSSGSSSITTNPPLSPTSHRDDEFMNEETYSFELLDDDDDMDGFVGGGGSELRSMEDEWRCEGFEDDDGFEYDEYDEDEEDEDEDLYEDVEEEDDHQQVEGDQTKMPGIEMKKGVGSFTSGEDQDQDPDAEGEMEIDIEPFQDPTFNAELSSPTSLMNSASKSKTKSTAKTNAVVDNAAQSFVSSFYVPPIPPHVHMEQQRQEEQHQIGGETPSLVPSSPDSSSHPLSLSSEGTSTSTTGQSTAANNHGPPMQILLPPASHHHYPHQVIQLSPSILPLPPPRLDSVRVFVLRQSEMGGLKTTGRGTPADRRRAAIWGWGGIGGGGGGGDQVGQHASGGGNKRRMDNGKESESESESDDEEDEGGKRGRPRLRLMLADQDIVESEDRRGRGRQEDSRGNGVKTTLRLSLPDDTDAAVRMPAIPTGFKCDMPESNDSNNSEDIQSGGTHKPSSLSSFVATDSTWDAFLASLDDKSQPQQQQGEEGTLDTSVIAADRETTTHGQLLLDHHLHRRRLLEESEQDALGSVSAVTLRAGVPSSTLEGTFMFDQGGDTWFVSGNGDGVSESGGSGSGRSGVGLGGTCPADALALEGFNFPVGPDGSSTLSYALG